MAVGASIVGPVYQRPASRADGRVNGHGVRRVVERVAEVLVRNAIDARIQDVANVGGLLSFRVRVDGASKVMYQRAVGLGPVLSNAVGRPVSWVQSADGLWEFSVILNVQKVVTIADLVRAGGLRMSNAVPIGLTPFGRAVGVELGRHFLVTGSTGCGKTEVLCTFLTMMALQDNGAGRVRWLILDAKRESKLAVFAGCRELLHPPVLADDVEAGQVLRWVADYEIPRRYGLDVAQRECEPMLVVVIDEAIEVAAGSPVARARIEQIVRLGREARVMLIASYQYVRDAPDVFANIPLRLTGKVAGASAAYVNAAQARTGANELLMPGHFVLTLGGYSLRVIAAKAEAEVIADLPRGGAAAIDFAAYGLDEELDEDRARRDITSEMLEWYRNGGTVRGFKQRFGAGTTFAMRVRREALGMEGGDEG